MASPTSDIKFPEMIQTLSGFRCSAAYRYNVTVSSDQNHFLNLKQLKHIDLSEIDETTTSVTYRKEVISFENGAKVYADFKLDQELVPNFGYGLACQLYMKKPNGTEVTMGQRYFPQIAGGGWGIAYSPANLVKQFGVYFYITCHFDYYQDIETVPGVTGMDSITFDFLVPCRDSQYPDMMRSNTMKTEDTLYFLQRGTNARPKDLPNEWYYPTDQVPVLGFSWGFNDFDAFAALASDPNDPITPDQIFKKGDMDEPIQETDPSGPGGGGGNYDDDSDPIPFPDLPSGGALSSGAIKGFIVSNAILTALFNKLWDISIFDIATQFQKLVDNPMDCIISLHCIPVTPANSNQQQNIKIGSFDTDVKGVVITSQYLTVDCGSLNVKEYWGTAMDYSPYTKCEIYMPFIGIHELKIEDVMKSTVHIKYNVDVLTGDVLCNIKCGKSVLYKYAGNFKQDIPVSGRTNNMALKGILGGVGAIGAAAIGAATGGPMGGAIAGGGVLSSAASVASSKVVTSRSGSLQGSVGLLDDFRPFLIFHRPVQSLARNFNSFKGYPSNIYATLNSLSGYTEVEYVHLTGIDGATDTELEEIEALLKKGVII